MALRNQPYIPLYVQDYLTDEKLNECCAASQGVYIKILCLMHKSEQYGTILLKQKDKQAPKRINNFAYKLAKHLLFTQDEIEKALIELLQEKVLQIKGDTLSQKRMIKDNILSIKRAESGAKGGKRTQLAKAKTQANTEDEYAVESVTDYENVIRTLWISTFGKNPSIPEQDETKKLLDKFGYDKIYKAMYEAKLKNFHSIRTLADSLDNDGNIKPKDGGGNGHSETYTPEAWEQMINHFSVSVDMRKKYYKEYDFDKTEKLWRKK